MNDLESTIRALSDDEAISMLSRFVRAFRTGASSEGLTLARADALARTLSLPTEDIAPVSASELAKSALAILASDDRFRRSIVTLLGDRQRSTFARGGNLDAGDVWAVLDTQLAAADGQPGLVRTLARQLIAYAGFGKASPQSDAEYEVWYATSRKLLEAGNPSAGFGTERDDRIHFGSCRVFVPRSHKVGSLGSPWWKRTLTVTDDRLRLLGIDASSTDTFWLRMREHLAQCPEEDQDAVVFIHGFNVDFQEAALRAAQIGFDLQVRGAMAFYSWASRGDAKMYLADAAAVELDEDLIADYLCDFARLADARKVHVIAHSMGNRVVLRAVARIVSKAERRAGGRFGQFILAAADVDARKFLQMCSAYPALAERTTLYVSQRDAAVEASRWLHDFPRAGLMPPVTVAPGIDTVNARNTDLTLLGHGYVAEARAVVSDIHALIQSGVAPERRFGLRAMRTGSGEQYWLMDA